MLVVPVELGRDALGGVVRLLERVGLQELRDRVARAAHAPQVVRPHVVRVRHARREPRVDLAVRERVVDAADHLVRVDQVVVRGQVLRAHRERALVERDRGRAAALAAPGGGRLLGVAAQQPELDVVHVLAERLVERLLVRGVARLAREVVERVELGAAQREAAPLARARRGGERLAELQLAPRGRLVLERGRDARQPEVGERELRVEPQRLAEGARGLDPDVGVEVRDALVVERLGLGRGGRDGIVHLASAAAGPAALAQRDGLVEQALRHPADGGAGGVRVVGCLGEGSRRRQARPEQG